MKITKEDVINNLEEVKKYIQEEENKKEEKVVGIAIKNRFTGEIIFQSTKTTYKEAIEEKGDANLRDADLSGVDLSGVDLSGVDLCDADLSGSNLSSANLSGANLRSANLSGAELNNTKFYGRGGNIVIKKANLEGFLGALGFKLEE